MYKLIKKPMYQNVVLPSIKVRKPVWVVPVSALPIPAPAIFPNGKVIKKKPNWTFCFFLTKKWHRIWGGRAAVGPKIVLHFSPALFFGRPAHFFLPHGPPVNPKWTQPQHCLKKRAHANVRYTIIFAKSGFLKIFAPAAGRTLRWIFWWPRQTSAPCGIDSARRDLSIGAFSAHSNMSVEKFSQIQLRSRKCRKNQ